MNITRGVADEMMEIGEMEGFGESFAYQLKRYELGSLKMDVLKAKSSIFLVNWPNTKTQHG